MAAGAHAPVLAQSNAAAEAGEADQARTIADLQRQIDELKAVVEQLQAARSEPAPAAVSAPPPQLADQAQRGVVVAQAEPSVSPAAPKRKAGTKSCPCAVTPRCG